MLIEKRGGSQKSTREHQQGTKGRAMSEKSGLEGRG